MARKHATTQDDLPRLAERLGAAREARRQCQSSLRDAMKAARQEQRRIALLSEHLRSGWQLPEGGERKVPHAHAGKVRRVAV